MGELTDFFTGGKTNLIVATSIGIVTVIQTFGDYGRWHPHLHAMVAEGLFCESGSFFVMPKGDARPCAELFRAYVLRMFRKKGLIDDSFIEMIMKWRHVYGFSVHNKVRVKAGDDTEVENLAQYIIRNSYSLTKLTYLKDSETVVYRSKMSHIKNKKKFQVFTPLECIAAIMQHIPEMAFQLVSYYGWQSKRMRGDRDKREMDDSSASELVDRERIDIRRCKAKRIPQLMWRVTYCITLTITTSPILESVLLYFVE